MWALSEVSRTSVSQTTLFQTIAKNFNFLKAGRDIKISNLDSNSATKNLRVTYTLGPSRVYHFFIILCYKANINMKDL